MRDDQRGAGTGVMPGSASTRVIDLRDAPRTLHQPDLFERVVTALNSPLELRDVLRLLADIAVETVGGEHASVFLLEDRKLYPAVAVAAEPDTSRWSTFRSMGPIELTHDHWRYLVAGDVVAFEDARESAFVPSEWVEAFDLRALLLVPLRWKGEPCGLMAFDWSKVRTFSSEEIRVLDALGSYVGVAVSSARPFDTVRRRARLQAALARGAAALASPLAPDEIVERLVAAYTELLAPAVCGVALVDSSQSVMTTVATANGQKVEPMPVSVIPEHLVGLLGETWAREKRPVELDDDPWLADLLGGEQAGATWYLALPLLNDGHTGGGVLLGFEPSVRLDAEEQAAASALAAIGAAALERHALIERLDRQLRRLDVLYHVSTALVARADAGLLVAKLNQLLSTHGVEVVGVAFRDRRLLRHLGGDEPLAEERTAWRSGDGWARLRDGGLGVPMRLGHRVVGDLRVRASALDAETRSFLETLASELAEVAMRGALRAEVEEGALERAVATERERFASDLHDTAGQLFVALGLFARRLAESMPPDAQWTAQVRRFADLADRGKDEINHAVRAQAFLPVARQGLAPSVRALAQSIAADSGIDVRVKIHGRAVRVRAPAERALYRVVGEALANAWRHAQCRSMTVELGFGPREVTVRVTDDGVGLTKAPEGSGMHMGVQGMHRAMAEVGGTVELRAREPQGTVVEARVSRVATSDAPRSRTPDAEELPAAGGGGSLEP